MTFKRSSTVHPINIDVGSSVDNALVQKHVEKLALKGVDLTDVNDEDEQFRAARMIRSIPAPIPIKRVIRRKYISGPIRKVSGCASCRLGIKRRWRNFKAGLGELGYKISLFNGSFKSIEGYQGSGVLSYFIFLKWLLKLNFAIFLLVFLFTTLPEVIFSQQSFSSTTANLSAAAALAQQCSANYAVTTSPYVLDNVQDFLQGTGWMEKTVMFLGDYSSSELYIGSSGDSTFQYNLPLAVLTVAAVCLTLSLILMAAETAIHFRKSLANGENDTFVNKVFCAWDFAIENDDAASVSHGSIYMNLWADIDEAVLAKQRLELTKCDKCRLYTLRGVINFIVVALIGGSIYLIYFVSDFSTEYIKSPDYKTADSFVQLLVEFLPSLTITGVNSVCPIIFGLLIKFEKYSAGFQVQLMLLRIVFLKMISLAVLVAQLYIEIKCSTKNSCGVGDGTTCVAIKCWETYVGQQFYKLVILDFFVLVVVTFFVEFPRKLIVTKCNCCLSRIIGRQEYDIPKNVLDLVYSQMLIWIGFFFAPLVPSVVVPKLFFTFYLKKFSALVSCVPPQRPYKASKANTFFMIILMFAFFLSTVPIIGSVVSIDPSKSCGPFRMYDDIYDVYGVMIAGWPSWMQSVMNVLSSAVFILPLLFILGLGIYYFKVVSRGNQDIIKQLKEQLVMEGRDRQYLIQQLGPAYGGKSTKPKTPPKVVEPRPNSEVTSHGMDPQDDTWA